MRYSRAYLLADGTILFFGTLLLGYFAPLPEYGMHLIVGLFMLEAGLICIGVGILIHPSFVRHSVRWLGWFVLLLAALPIGILVLSGLRIA